MEVLTELLKKEYSENVYIELFNILETGDNYTKNLNGIFFDLKNVEPSKIQMCIKYLNSINKNIEDHFEKLTTRETIEKEYKSIINNKREKKKEKQKEKVVTIRKPIDPKWLKPIKYKGAYARIDDVLHNRKTKVPKEKAKEKLKEIEEIEEEIEKSDEEIQSEEEEDLFGESSSDEDDKSIS